MFGHQRQVIACVGQVRRQILAIAGKADEEEIAEPAGPCGAADAVSLVEQAQSRVPHVLRHQVRGLRDRQKVLHVSAL